MHAAVVAGEALKYADFVYYTVERQLTAHPTKCWVVRVVDLDPSRRITPILGPFNGKAGDAAAQTIANQLNSHSDLEGVFEFLTEPEKRYVQSRLVRAP